jgi:protein-L-isoaspartate(D-aspartate) O-methyltransferase
LIWPGGLFAGGGNFGVPQLLGLAAIARRAGADVSVIDLDCERALSPRGIDLRAIVTRDGLPDLIGIACYSSFDYLKVLAIAEHLKAIAPRAWIATGGYHPSARPHDFTRPGTPIDFVIVGDGEGPFGRLVAARISGKRPLNALLGPESTPDPDGLDPVPWELLERYRPIARKVASQAEIYLSRGCPYDCAFCMERAKRDTSWRAIDPERAIEEIHRLDRFLDLTRWTVFVADALFGMKRSWRRTFLEGLARRPIRARKIWLLIRLDLLEREDLELMARANVAPGFGLESGDEGQLRRIRKAGRLDGYLDHMRDVAGWCHELGVPFGANVIVGHPGETEATLRTSAAYLSRLFLDDPRGTMGFLSVDPFRLYPGSPIDEEFDDWSAKTGMRVHRREWWHDGDQDFLSEWVDPSADLDFRRTLRLRHELFRPILEGIKPRFAYRGPSRDYFLRSVDESIALHTPRKHLRTLAMENLWRGLVADDSDAVRATTLAADAELAAVAREARAETIDRLGPMRAALRRAVERVPRERFVDEDDVPLSADDRPLTIGPGATISAIHAYLTSFEALDLAEGDDLVELGAGSGYGVAVAAEIVGQRGKVRGVEIDETLAARAGALVNSWPNASVVHGDAHDTAHVRGARKVSVAFAMSAMPAAILDALADGGVVVAPIGDARSQILTRFEKGPQGIAEIALGPVRYVPDRSTRAGAAPVDSPRVGELD